jgi:hypothetical protein
MGNQAVKPPIARVHGRICALNHTLHPGLLFAASVGKHAQTILTQRGQHPSATSFPVTAPRPAAAPPLTRCIGEARVRKKASITPATVEKLSGYTGVFENRLASPRLGRPSGFDPPLLQRRDFGPRVSLPRPQRGQKGSDFGPSPRVVLNGSVLIQCYGKRSTGASPMGLPSIWLLYH